MGRASLYAMWVDPRGYRGPEPKSSCPTPQSLNSSPTPLSLDHPVPTIKDHKGSIKGPLGGPGGFREFREFGVYRVGGFRVSGLGGLIQRVSI